RAGWRDGERGRGRGTTGMTTASAARDRCGANELGAMAGKFVAGTENAGYESYDPYDVWGPRYGRVARRLYYRKHPLGLALTAPLVLVKVLGRKPRSLLAQKG